MYCPFCGTDNPDERKFCLACGTPLEAATKPTETTVAKKQPAELRLKIVREQEPVASKPKETKSPADQPKSDQVPAQNGKHSIGRVQQVPIEASEVPVEEKHELYKQVLETPKPSEPPIVSPVVTPKPTVSENLGVKTVGEQLVTETVKTPKQPPADQPQAKIEIKNEDHNFEPEQTVGLKRGVLLGEEDYFETQPPDKDALRKSNFRIMGIIALTWVFLVAILSFTYLSFSSPDGVTPVNPVNEFEILAEVSDFKARGEQQGLKLSWIPAASPVKIVDQLLEVYDLDGKLVKELKIGSEAFAYNLSGLEPGQKYRLTLKLEAEDGRESGGNSLIVTFPSDFDKQRKQDLAELKEALEIYKSKHGKYPVSRNFASLLNTLIQDKILKRRIKDPEYPTHSYEYKVIWEGAGYEIKIYLGNPADELFGGQASPNQIYTYTPLDEQTAAEAVLDQAQATQEASEQEY